MSPPAGGALLDINVLLALAWPQHLHHERARRWFGAAAGDGWATTPVTELGFVRISTNRVVVDEPVAPVEALACWAGCARTDGTHSGRTRPGWLRR